MGTPYPTFALPLEVQRRFPMLADTIEPAQAANRRILRSVMTTAGFVWYPGEWWHYCWGDRMWAVYSRRSSCPYGPVELDPDGRSVFAS